MPLEIVLWKAGGPVYLTRDGRRAVVLESNIDLETRVPHRIWQGRVNGEWCEWERDGRHCGGEPGLDLVAVAD